MMDLAADGLAIQFGPPKWAIIGSTVAFLISLATAWMSSPE